MSPSRYPSATSGFLLEIIIVALDEVINKLKIWLCEDELFEGSR
jgi:hypothetical protein